jgi:hypothetical protein
MAKHVRDVGSVAHQPAGCHKFTCRISCRNPVARRQSGKLHAAGSEERIGSDEKAIGALARKGGKGKAPVKLARSAGASPAQVRPSKPPGSECCVRRQQCRTRSVHSGCVGCVIEPRNTLFAGAEVVLCCRTPHGPYRYARYCLPCRGRRAHHAQKDRVGTWEILRLTACPRGLAARIGKARSHSR